MAKLGQKNSTEGEGSGSGLSPDSKELIMRLASEEMAKEESELRSIAEAMGKSVEQVALEKEKMEIEARLNRIEAALEKVVSNPPKASRGNFGDLLEFLKNPGTGIENLFQCIGAAIILLVIGSVIAWGIHINRSSRAVLPQPEIGSGATPPYTGAQTGTTGTPLPTTGQ